MGLRFHNSDVIIDVGQGLPRELIPTINTFIADTLAKDDVRLIWTSLQLNLNTVSDWHQDWGNIGLSAIGALGDYHGGEFQLQGFPHMDINGKLMIFDGRVRHRSLPFRGTRLSFVAFRHPGIFKCDNKYKGRLKALGFVVDDPGGWIPPVRTGYDPKKLWDPSYLYIGRGSDKDGVPRSDWANPHSIKHVGSRDAAIDSFKKYLNDNASLRSRAGELEGRKLMCHCSLDEDCHGDVLIELYKKHVRDITENTRADPPEDKDVQAEATRRRQAVAGAAPKDLDGRSEPTVAAGEGPPLYVFKGHHRRVLSEGGGLCSPGLWPPDRRFEPEGGLLQIRGVICAEINKIYDQPGGINKFLANMIGGKLTESPFPPEGTERIRKIMHEVSPDVPEPPGARDHTIDLELIHRLLVLAKDPDADILALYRVGVPIGVGVELPRTESVFPPKTRWNIKEQSEWGGESTKAAAFVGKRRSNYPSAETFAAEVEKVLRDQADRGQVRIMPFREALDKYGTRLAIASLAALEKGVDQDGNTEVRIIHDGTNGVDVNRFIKVVDGGCCPTAPDIKCAMREQRASGIPHFGLTLDVKEAHRMVAVREEDWPLQACQVRPGGDVFLNTCGTYGIASAAYWWGRLAAAIHRLGLKIAGRLLGVWKMLFADDWNMTAGGEHFEFKLLLFAWVLVALRVPISWKKASGGLAYSWVGLEVNLREWSLGISERRAAWLLGWFDRVLADDRILMRELREALGRMVFVYGAIKHDKPFLAPLFAFLATRPDGACAELPLYVRMVLEWLRTRLRTRRAQEVPAARHTAGSLFRVDAKAEGMSVAIGGWSPTRDEHGVIQKSQSKWFHIRLTPEDAPWAFARGLPAHSISTLELLASLVGLVLLVPPSSPGAGTVTITGFTDSQVSASVVARGMSTTYPLCCVAMELSAQLELRKLDLSLEWAPRDQNTEADALADERIEGFNPSLRVGTGLGDISWLVLPGLLRTGDAFYKAAGKRPPAQTGPKAKKRLLAGERLRDREPW